MSEWVETIYCPACDRHHPAQTTAWWQFTDEERRQA